MSLKRPQGRALSTLIKGLGYPAESREYRLKIKGIEDFRAYGQQVLRTFEQRAEAAGIQIARPSFEGVRLVFPDGWALLRLSLHDPNMPLNVESREAGGARRIAADVQKLLADFDKLDQSVFNS